jgi:hypothetical protein
MYSRARFNWAPESEPGGSSGAAQAAAEGVATAAANIEETSQRLVVEVLTENFSIINHPYIKK